MEDLRILKEDIFFVNTYKQQEGLLYFGQL